MDVVEMVLSGRVNKGLVTLIQQAGGRAVGVCGKDSGIIKARMVNSTFSLRNACLQRLSSSQSGGLGHVSIALPVRPVRCPV